MKLLDEAPDLLAVTIVEPREEPGRGVAYSATERVLRGKPVILVTTGGGDRHALISSGPRAFAKGCLRR